MCDLICGTYFKHQCRFQLTDYSDARNHEFSFVENSDLDNDFVFCKTEYLKALPTYLTIGAAHLPPSFNLVTHNSDLNFGEPEIGFVLSVLPQVKHWYTQNLVVSHPKVSPIPIGIANPKWSHGNQDRFKRVMDADIKKSNNVYINFNVSTNPSARNYCIEHTTRHFPLSMQVNYPNAASLKDHDNFVNSTQDQYLENIASSYFTVSPVGNGVCCHKTWEALYMKSIPIVTRWHGVERFKELGIPMIILNDWSEFDSLGLNSSSRCRDLYDEVWGTFENQSLNFNFFKQA